MTARALIIGSEIAGLTGVTRDLDIVGALLTDRGFEVRRHERDTATRDAVGQALRDLATDTGPGDAVVVYYSGHGGRVQDTGGPSTGPAAVRQFIAPYDYLRTTPEDFRGITALELSTHLAALSERTRNVTAIFDCCYSSRMARDRSLIPRAVPRISSLDITAHLARIGIDRLAGALGPDVESNRDVVRLVAAGPAQQAFEYPGPGGVQVGLLTEGLRRLLVEAADRPVTWTQVAARLREFVQVLVPAQRPEAEGPADRLLFSTEVLDRADVLAVRPAAGGTTLDGGRLAGVAPGDVYAVLDPASPEPTRPVAHLTVTSVTATSAAVDVQLVDGVAALPTTGVAHPVARAGRLRPVVVVGDPVPAEPLLAALVASAHVDPVAVDAAGVGLPPLATVEVSAAGLDITDGAGPIAGPIPNDEVGRGAVLRDLHRLARASAVRALDPGDAELGAGLAVSWGRVVDGSAASLPASGATLFVGDRVWFGVRNTGPGRLFVFALGVGGSGRVQLLTNDPSGLALDPGEEWVVGRRPELDGPTGLLVGWPEGVSPAGPRPESVLVIATSRQQDLRFLEQEGAAGKRGGRQGPLEQLLAQIVDGGRRDAGGSADLRYAVLHIEYLLLPTARPLAETAAYLLDDRPDVSMSILAPRGGSAAAVAVRLAELVVAPDRAPGTGGLRLDALVLTGGATPVRSAGTWRSPRVRVDDRVSFDDLLLHSGRARDRLDVAIWLSPDLPGGPDLGAVLAPVSEPVSPDAGVEAAVALFEACSTAVEQAGRALATALGETVPVYRGSFLDTEDFGLGEHPGVARGISLRLCVAAIGVP